MDQLVVLQEIYASFSKGRGWSARKSTARPSKGAVRELVGSIAGRTASMARIEEGICRKLSGSLQDVYELKRLGDRTAAGLACTAWPLDSIQTGRYLSAAIRILRPGSARTTWVRPMPDQGDIWPEPPWPATRRRLSSFALGQGTGSGLAHVLGNLGSAYLLETVKLG